MFNSKLIQLFLVCDLSIYVAEDNKYGDHELDVT